MTRELVPIDISDSPDLVRLAEEVIASQQPHVLRRDHVDLAVISPIVKKVRRGGKVTVTAAAMSREDDGVNIWQGYDPARARQALQQSAGTLKGLDRDQFRRDLAEAREQRGFDLPD